MKADNEVTNNTLYNFAPSGYFLLDREGLICELNHSGSRMLGQEQSRLVNKNFRQFVTHDSLHDFNIFLEKAFDTNSKDTAEIKLSIKGNSYFYVFLESFCTENQQRLLVAAVDITERKQTKNELRRNEEKCRKLLELAPDAFFQGDSLGNFITINGNAIELTGYSREELLTMNMNQLFDAGILKINPLRYDLLKDGKTLKTERSIIRKTGEQVPVEMHSKAMPDGTFQCFMRNTTERKKTEELLRMKEERFRQLIENSFDMIVLLDINGIQHFVSESCEKILGYRPEDLINIPVIEQMIHPDDREKLISEFRNAIENGSGGAQYRHRHKNGGWVHLEAYGTNQLNNPAIKSLVLNVRDITERKLAEEALKENETILRELNATKDKFFSIIAHDLKSPFHSIIGFSNLLVRQIQVKNDEEIEKYATIIQESAQHTMNLLMNLLEWSRSQTGMMDFNPVTFNIGELITEVIKLFNGSAQQKSISISSDFPHNLNVFADKAMISTILRNLISNSIKFTHPKGRIVISAIQENDEIVVSVNDNGIGIKKSAIGKLFRIDQNYTKLGTNNEKGTGLGLILCKAFVEKHGGKIWVETSSDENAFETGSKFYFMIPVIN